MWDLIVSVPDHCLVFYLVLFTCNCISVYVFVLLDHVPVITILFYMFVFVYSLLFTVVNLRFTE